MKRREKVYKKIDIENVINQRLQLQTVRKNLDNKFNNYGFNSAAEFKNIKFLDYFLNLSEDKRKDLLITLGGPANYTLTASFFNKLTEEKLKTGGVFTDTTV